MMICALVALSFFYSISVGKRRSMLTIIYTYVALALWSAVPLNRIIAFIPIKETAYAEMGVFLLLVFLLVFLMAPRRRYSRPASWWQVFLLSLLEVGFLAHILLGFLPPEKIRYFSPLIKALFLSPEIHQWWLLMPIIALIFIRWSSGRED